jgi:hypothetical protein
VALPQVLRGLPDVLAEGQRPADQLRLPVLPVAGTRIEPSPGFDWTTPSTPPDRAARRDDPVARAATGHPAAADIRECGETPLPHVLAIITNAVRLCEKLGFRLWLRTDMVTLAHPEVR